ncbi:MAG: peptidylprolyl isomerase [Salegentibacter sp.]
MAVLNKIRQRSVFLILIIGLALFSFILSSLLKKGGLTSNKSQNTIATVNGQDIDRQEFARQVDALQRNSNGAVSTTQAVNRVWDQKLREVIIEDQLEELGVRAEQAQVRQLLRTQMANNPNFTNEAGMFDENKLKEYVATLKATSPQAYQQWVTYENSLSETARQNIYLNMISAGVGATLTEAEQAYRLNNNNIDLKFVQIPYSSVADDQVEVSKADIRDYVKAHSAEFETEAARDIQYVYFEEKASAEDKGEAKDALNKMMEDRLEYNSASNSNDTLRGFANTSDNEEFVNTNSDLPYQDRYVFKSDLPKVAADQIYNLNEGEVYGPYEDNGYWKLTKLIDAKQMPDSVKASHILISYKGLQYAKDATRTKAEAKELADSLANVIKKDKSKMDALAAEFSADPSNKDKGGDLGYFRPGMMVPEFEEFAFNHDKGDVGVVQTDFGYHVVYVTDQTDKQKAVKVATVAREIEASERSRNNLFNEVTKFEMAAGDGSFTDLAKESNYNVRTVKDIKALDENIPGVGAQRRIVQWAFKDESSVGDIKRFETSGGYVVAQLTDKKKKGLMSAEEASATVTPILMKEKKAEIIKNNIKGTDLSQIAQNHDQQVQTASAVNMASPVLPGAGNEPEVVGSVFALDEGQVSQPIEGKKGVYVVELVKRHEAPAMNSYKGIAEQETLSRRRTAATRAYDALKKKAEIEDKRAKFY